MSRLWRHVPGGHVFVLSEPSLAVGYFLACLLLAATPGADMALFLSRTLGGGRAQGFAAQAGRMRASLSIRSPPRSARRCWPPRPRLMRP